MGTPATGGVWIQGTIGDANTLLPVLATDSASFDVIGRVFCKLLEYDGQLELRGDLAERYEVLDEGLRLRFYLREGARWHDGESVTAADVKFSYDLLMDEDTPSPYKSRFARVSSLQVVDRHTVEVRYDEPFAPALNSWASSFYVMPKHLLAGEDLLTTKFARNPVGCGPYKFVNWESQREIKLRANDDYYRGRPNIDETMYRIIPDQATMFLELLNHGVDQMGLTPEQYRYQAKGKRFDDHFRRYRYTGFNYTYLGFNLRREKFADRNVRRALAHAVDKQEIVDGVLLGLGETATGPYRPGMWYHTSDVSEPEFDPERARALLAQAGWKDADGDGIRERDGERFSFTMLTNQGNQQRKQVGEILQARFKDVGVEAELRILEWSTFLNEFVDKHRFDAVILGWGTGIDPDQYLIWHSSKTGPKEFNFIGFSNARVDALLEQGRSTFDRDERAAAYHELQKILAWEQPYVFLYIPESTPAVHRRVQGIEPAPAGIGYNFERWWIPKSLQGFHRAP